jgi:hypothetical protein
LRGGNCGAKMRMKTLSEEFEFGGLGDFYIKILGCLKHFLATAPYIS